MSRACFPAEWDRGAMREQFIDSVSSKFKVTQSNCGKPKHKKLFFFFLVVSTGQNTTSWSMGLNSCRETWKHRAMIQVDLNNCSATTYHMDIFVYQDHHPRQTMTIMRKATTKYCCFFPYKFHNWNCVWVKKGMLREKMAFAIQSSIDYWWGACVWVVLMNSVLPPH